MEVALCEPASGSLWFPPALGVSRRGNRWDDAVAERFFATLKVDLVA